ncbi:hypothetical protein PCO85_11865 [Prodigiosinella aquatilis]|nr:hypothetical protein [Prodigiosinella sp. LS101]WJV51965.1 hypothetical protein PCO85_11865 [Prodigiosinella sp. LS101]WJV56321.1 hypothetical protein PCO84_11865 [Pectobacteriaceae bacterium C111]
MNNHVGHKSPVTNKKKIVDGTFSLMSARCGDYQAGVNVLMRTFCRTHQRAQRVLEKQAAH